MSVKNNLSNSYVLYMSNFLEHATPILSSSFCIDFEFLLFNLELVIRDGARAG